MLKTYFLETEFFDVLELSQNKETKTFQKVALLCDEMLHLSNNLITDTINEYHMRPPNQTPKSLIIMQGLDHTYYNLALLFQKADSDIKTSYFPEMDSNSTDNAADSTDDTSRMSFASSSAAGAHHIPLSFWGTMAWGMALMAQCV